MTSQCCCTSDSCSSARNDKCQKQNSDPIDLFRRFSMDLEFNIIGFGYTKSCSGINLLHFGTTLVYWASIYHQFLIHSTVRWFFIILKHFYKKIYIYRASRIWTVETCPSTERSSSAKQRSSGTNVQAILLPNWSCDTLSYHYECLFSIMNIKVEKGTKMFSSAFFMFLNSKL